jgi:uncharacterized protein (DUF1697 family)
VTVQIALLRGINVGGHNTLPMADFRKLLERLGAQSCKTYIQSGNAVFVGDLAEGAVGEAIETEHGFRPRVMIRTRSFWDATIKACPFPTDTPKALHLFVLGEPTKATDDALNQMAALDERAQIGTNVVYLHTPGGMSASKLAPRIDRVLGVPTTARNWRSVLAVRDLAAKVAKGTP